jgi:hypothetical protein
MAREARLGLKDHRWEAQDAIRMSKWPGKPVYTISVHTSPVNREVFR